MQSLTLTVSLAHWNVIALVTSPAAWATAAGSSVGDGGVSSVLPYFTNVANRGFVYAMKKKSLQINLNVIPRSGKYWAPLVKFKYWQLTHDYGW